MRYVLLIYGSEADSASMTQQERAALMQGHAAFAQEALAGGILTGGAPLHAQARRPEETDWVQIATLYRMLYEMMPSPVVELNRAVAVAMAEGIDSGMSLLDRLEETGELKEYYLFHAARADLLRRTGRLEESFAAYTRTLELCQNNTEQAFLRRRLAEIQDQMRR